MINKHFFKILVTFAVIILIGLISLYLANGLDETDTAGQTLVVGNCQENELC